MQVAVPPLPSLPLLFLSVADRRFRRVTAPAHSSSSPAAILFDLPRSSAELLAEKAPRRHPRLILNRPVKRPKLNRRDRFWLLILASRVSNWKQVLLIIQPDTLLRWHCQGFRLFWKHRSRSKTNQPKLNRETLDLIRRIARENVLWGSERIPGELSKLGIAVAKRTVQKYMRAVRPPPDSGQTWATFLKAHAKDIWACDFLPVVDLFFRHVFVFFMMELSSRRVVHCAVTRAPTEAWVAQQLREATPFGVRPKYLIRDNDNKYGTCFDDVAQHTEIEVLRIPYRAPRANAICERFLGSVRRECLDHLLIFSEQQLYQVVREYVAYFNRARPHQGLGQRIPEGPGEVQNEGRSGKIVSFPVLSGLHHDYRRVAWPPPSLKKKHGRGK
jgi:putative transposase